MDAGLASDDEMIRALVELPETGGPAIEQFGSIASGRQYRGLYALWRRHVPAGAEVLDWGAGEGHFSFFLARAGYRTSAYTFDRFLLGARLPEVVKIEASDPVALPFADASFDAVASVGVLEHVRETGGDEVRSLLEIRRVLRPHGHLIVWHLPNRWSWIELLAARLGGRYHHRYRYTPRDVRALAAAAGYELVESGRYGLLPRNVIARAPRVLRRSAALADIWDLADRVLAIPLGAIAQNNYAVLRKV